MKIASAIYRENQIIIRTLQWALLALSSRINLLYNWSTANWKAKVKLEFAFPDALHHYQSMLWLDVQRPDCPELPVTFLTLEDMSYKVGLLLRSLKLHCPVCQFWLKPRKMVF